MNPTDIQMMQNELAAKDATIAELQADNARLQKALQRISYHYDNQDMDHLEFRVEAATIARAALEASKP